MAGRPPKRKAPPLGKKLAVLRKARGLTQQQLADALGVRQSVVAYYEVHADNPSLEVLQKLAGFYNITVAELVDEVEATPPPKAKRARSPLDARLERLRSLPRREQERIFEMLDDAIDRAERRAST